MLQYAIPAFLVLGLALVFVNSSAKTLAIFAWNCFIKPFTGHKDVAAGQQGALESFYKGQANIYDRTRATLLKGREQALATTAAELRKKHDLVWVDIGGGTGWNIEHMTTNYLPISCFKAIYLVDLSPSLCEVARKRFAEKNWKNVHVLCIDAADFTPPAGSSVDLFTMSYSLSMIPTYYAVIDRLTTLLGKDGLVTVIDFYVQSHATLTAKSTTMGGELLRHVNWFSRTFWRLWFEFDRVYLDSARRDYLEYRFGTIKSVNCRNTRLGGIPYYYWIGCDKDRSTNILQRANALATESPYLSPQNELVVGDEDAANNTLAIRSKGYDAALVNMQRNFPAPSFFYQTEIWRIFYNQELPKYHQFANQYIYAFTWEDPREDKNILQFKPSDTVLAITSAGDNILSYASMDAPPKRIHCVDLNPCQNHLLELKLACLRVLPFEDMWKLFGEGKHPKFQELLTTKLAPHLSSHAFQYWHKRGNASFTGKGLFDTGSSRWAIRLAHWVFAISGVSGHINALCEAKTLDEQWNVWEKSLRPCLFNPIVAKVLVGNPIFLWKALGVPVEQTSMIEGGMLKFVIDTFEPIIKRSLISDDNYFYYLCLKGCYAANNCPDFLTKHGHANLAKRKGALDGIRIHTDEINEVVKRLNPGSVNHAIVMDHMDWFPKDGHAAREEIKSLHHALTEGGNVMLRSASQKPWYLSVYEEEGFTTRPAAIRESGTSIDRVNMYASTWVCTKKGAMESLKI